MLKSLRFIICLFLSLLFADELCAQKKRRPTATSHHRGRFKQINISRNKARVVCPIFEDSQYPYHGIGIKVGDPFAITYKYYAHENFSIAIDAGKTASGLYSEYYRENFGALTQPDTLDLSREQDVTYLGHIVNEDYVIEGKLLYQKDASNLLKGLQWYIGGGMQWRRTDIQYEFLVQETFDRTEIGVVDESYMTAGVVGALGIEYSYFTIPIAAFMEIEVYTDVLYDPGWSRFQGGVGLRWIF